MGKQRNAIRMSEAEIAAFLDECQSLQVATLDRDGAPHLTTLWFTVHEGDILFETYGRSQKLVNLRRDPRIAVLCEKGQTYDQLRGVSIQGRAEIVDEGERLFALMRRLVDHHNPGQDTEALDRMTHGMCAKRVVVVVKADKVISWDHRKIGKG